ncbi:hypothetical protein CHH91_00020 [Virgibacillus sp. 7505]|uniref:lipopolysaccharide biosynthesis protein n=1 Tax=Virgibacillus sp. 7505 TaxID=2022548 RepID=UPI000BA700AE|nr:lipopolysaccharide biosynthesis protein [Virgibacillus sp. 7505]PAE18200.1 hypothetical protein CHH91_00020 [Virgibacillus sp. 7505]
MNFLSNSVWSLINKVGVQLLTVIANLILANLLYPEIFGVLGMALVFSSFALIIQEAGLSSYIVYKEKLTSKDITTSFWLNIILSSIFTITLFLGADKVGEFYESKEVIIILHLLGIGLFLGSFGITSRALLVKNGKFKGIALIDLISELTSSIASIVFAVIGQEILAITSRFIIKPLLQSLMLLINGRKMVFGRLYFSSIRELLPFSIRILSARIFNYINKNIDYLLIGKLLGPRELGLYTLAFQWSMIVREHISGAILQVTFSHISKLNNSRDKVGKLYLNVIRYVSTVTFPLSLGLMACAPEFVNVFYGNKWQEAIIVLEILCLIGAITSIGTIGGAVFEGLGKAGIEMKLSFVSLICYGVCIIYGANFGIIGVSLGLLLSTVIVDLIKGILVLRLIKVKLYIFVKSLLPSVISSILMIISIYIYKSFVEFTDSITLISEILIGIIIYLSSLNMLDKELSKKIRLSLKNRLNKKRFEKNESKGVS